MGFAARRAHRRISGAAIGQTAVEKCLKWKNPVKLDPGKYTVVLEPTAVGDLVPLMASRCKRGRPRKAAVS